MTGIIIIIIAVVVFIKSIPTITKKENERQFLKNEQILSDITVYFKNLGYGYILIKSSDKCDTLYVASNTATMGERISIDNDKIENDINTLFKNNGYLLIEKGNNYVRFAVSGLLGHSGGYLYSLDRSIPISFKVSSLDKLSKDGWYWYVEN